MAVAPGDILLGKYRVERLLGQGGMGVVVAALHQDLGELFAIKLMLAGEMETREAEERFLREARAAAKLKGEHVARVLDVGRLPDGTPYMVMEHLTGTDLKRLLQGNGPLAVKDAVELALQACETLREAHGYGIVHRDIKPANIFLTFRPNGSPCVKVLDFGISKQVVPGALALTTTGTVGGSPLYMSPEQVRSTKYVDHRTDIWAMGILLYELLTGATPFHASVMTAVVGRVLQEEPLPPSRLRPEVPAWLDQLVLRCLAKTAEQRFQSMDELMAALRGDAPAPSSSAGEAPVSAGRSSLASSPRLSAATPVPAPPGAPGTTSGFSQISNARTSIYRGNARRNGLVFGLIAVTALGVGVAAGVVVLGNPSGDAAAPAAAPSGAPLSPAPSATAIATPPPSAAEVVPSAASASASAAPSDAPASPASAPASAKAPPAQTAKRATF